MTLYELMQEYSGETQGKTGTATGNPEWGTGLALFHASLVESGLEYEGLQENPRLTAVPGEIDCSHISHFIVAFLPFNSVTGKSEINNVLFEVYSFFDWMDKKNIPHGLTELNLMKLVRDLCAMQDRCLQLSHLLDNESGRVLEDPPEIVHTITDMFSVQKIENDMVVLKGRRQSDPVRLRLPDHILPLLRLHDCMDLVLGDTSEKWVLLEAGQVYPAYSLESST